MRKQITTIPQIKFLSLPGYNKFEFHRSISVKLPAVIWLRSVRLFRMSTHFGPMCCARVWQDCLNVLSLPRRTSWAGVGKTVEMYCHFPGGRHDQVLARLLKCTATSQAVVMSRFLFYYCSDFTLKFLRHSLLRWSLWNVLSYAKWRHVIDIDVKIVQTNPTQPQIAGRYFKFSRFNIVLLVHFYRNCRLPWLF
jgi:hypothetical protein